MTPLETPKPRLHGKILIILMLVGLFLRVQTIRWDAYTYPDSTRYLHLAKEMHLGTWFSPKLDLFGGFMDSRRLAPFYSLLISPFASEPDGLFAAGTMISLLASLLTFIPLFIIGEKLFGRDAALFACALWAIHPFVLYYSAQVLTEALFCLLFLSIIALIVTAFEKPDPKILAAAGALSAILYTTREAGVSAICVVLFALGCKWLFLDKQALRPTIKGLAVPLLAFLVFVAPFMLHLRIRLGRWAITGRFSKVGISRVVRAVGSTIDGKNSTRGRNAKVISGSYAAMVIAFGKKIVTNFSAYGAALYKKLGLLLCLLCLATLGALWNEPKKHIISVGLMALVVFQLLLLYAIATPCMLDARYVYPLMPICFLLASMGCIYIQEKLSVKRHHALAAAFSILLVTNIPTIGGVFEYYSAKTTCRLYSAGTKKIAKDIKASGLIPKGSMFLARKPFLPFLLEGNYYFVQGEHVAIPCTAKEVEELAKSGKVDYIVADSSTLAAKRKELLGMAFGTSTIPGTRLVYSRHLPQSGKVISLLACKDQGEGKGNTLQNTDEMLARAEDHLRHGSLAFAYQDVATILSRNPKHPKAIRIKLDLLLRYYDCLHSPQKPSVVKSIDILPNLVATARQVFAQNPKDREAAGILHTFEQILAAECKAVYQWDRPLWQKLEPKLRSLGLKA